MAQPNKAKILVLCVDRDNDIGVKAGIKTPVFGREENLAAACKLALMDPEESDANAIFEAVKTFDHLSMEGKEDYALATIAGSELGGVKADKVLRDELIEVLKKFPAGSVILITDGFRDEEVIPIIQSYVPLTSVKRVVIKHSESIEESWAILSRYVSRILEEPRYAHWFLGAPGILLTLFAIMWLTGFLTQAGVVFVLFLGFILIVKGFSLDEKIGRLIFPSPPNLIRVFVSLTSVIVVGLAIYQTYAELCKDLGEPSKWLADLPQTFGLALKYSINFLVMGPIIFSIGMAIYFYLVRDNRIWWCPVGIMSSIWMREVALSSSYVLLSPPPIPQALVLNFLIVSVLGILTTAATAIVSLKFGKRFEHHFKQRGVSSDEG